VPSTENFWSPDDQTLIKYFEEIQETVLQSLIVPAAMFSETRISTPRQQHEMFKEYYCDYDAMTGAIVALYGFVEDIFEKEDPPELTEQEVQDIADRIFVCT